MDETNLIPTDTGAEIRMARSPETVLAEAKLCAKALGRMVEQTKAFTVVGGRRHLHFTAWQTLGTMFRVTPRVRETRFIELDGVKGFECIAEAYHVPTGQVVSVAESQCMNDEPNWSVRPGKNGDAPVPLFQLRSMAQTRACAKALRNVLSWVVVLAGYEATAAEEMTGDEHQGENGGGSYSQPQRKQNGGAPSTGLISEAQGRRLWALAKTANKSNDEVGIIIAHFGFRSSEEITRDKYEAICAEVMKRNGGQQ